jgi:predicted ATP-grasp superfamily ATP-dependent carboligase
MVVSSPVPLLILGASARAAAQSACRAGFPPLCVDAYADRDLREISSVWPWPGSTRHLLEWLPTLPSQAWIYTGGLENRPGLVSRLARRVPLWGNDAPVLRLARDPLTIHHLLEQERLPALPVRPADRPPPGNGHWLIKLCRGSGGRGIAPWRGHATALPQEPYYFQQRVAGVDVSALYLAREGGVEYIGSTRQWSCQTGSSTPLHAWHGNIVGEELTPEVEAALYRIGQVLVGHLGLRGLFGCDFRLEGSTPWLLEINPRYTGSVELFEWSLQRPLLRDHACACNPTRTSCDSTDSAGLGPDTSRTDDERADPEFAPSVNETVDPGLLRRVFAKRVVYATQPGVAEFPRDLPRWTGGFAPAPVSDIPMPGQSIRPGDPICSILTSGSTTGVCERAIEDWLRQIHSWIRPA